MATAMKINSDGTGITIGDAAPTSNQLLIYNKSATKLMNTGGGAVTLLFDRNTSSSWKLINSGGDFYFQNDWVNDAKGDWFTAFRIYSGSANVEFQKGSLLFPSKNTTSINNSRTGNEIAAGLGYVNVMRFSFTDAYANTPIQFTVCQRRLPAYDVSFTPTSVNSTTPSIEHFTATAPGRQWIYAHVSGSVVNFYVYRTESYDDISINNLVYPRYSRERLNISFPNTLVTSLPSGYVRPSDDKVVVGTSSTSSGNSGQFYIQY